MVSDSTIGVDYFMGDKPQAIKVEALKAHTYNGKAYEVGDTYDFYPSTEPSGISADAQADSLLAAGLAARVDRAKIAKEAARAAAKPAANPSRKAKAVRAPRLPKGKASKKR
jgi:hypothetical protein